MRVSTAGESLVVRVAVEVYSAPSAKYAILVGEPLVRLFRGIFA
jgi:hypothetical protein